MRILPAVDIRGGLCVNLVQGDYGQETVFTEDPVAQAAHWRSLGASLVHVVDLDGAREGRVCAAKALRAMKERGVPFEAGGGIRGMAAVDAVIEAGADRVILGTAAQERPAFLAQAARAYPGRVVAGIDARAGKVATRGWLESTDTEALELARAVEQGGASRIIYTDILSDGMMKGPNVEATAALAEAVHIPVTASGGVSRLEDIEGLRAIEATGVDEVIIGRALYLGTFTLDQAFAAAQG